MSLRNKWRKCILKACPLKEDIESFAYGDQTVIGERGIDLSDGQNQRVQLARALYQDVDIYPLDDPFSADNAHASTHIFKKCVPDILSKKTIFYPGTDLLELVGAHQKFWMPWMLMKFTS